MQDEEFDEKADNSDNGKQPENQKIEIFNDNDSKEILRVLKSKVRNLPCLYLPVPQAFKVVETDADARNPCGISKLPSASAPDRIK
ncbi:hypothetical protein PIB30_090432 [Stylosanthes scabra]|uniref:Uncharacterized protein n=1 Tax=Stylosanthes scabra TaxID=79078 RepID=A0ABU6UWR8_9FABA|nr:hypothetical protein [Stylosanthes scabra]